MFSVLLLCTALGQLSDPPIFPADEVPLPSSRPSLNDAPRNATLVPRNTPAVTSAQLVGRAALSPLIAFGVGVLTVPLSIYLGALVGGVVDPQQGESVGGGVGAIIGGALGYVIGTTIASSLFERDPTAIRRALPWAITASLLSTLGVCLVFFLPAVGIGALPFIIAGAVVLAAAVPLVTEAVRPKPPQGVNVATF
jgi:hypothetical protein